MKGKPTPLVQALVRWDLHDRHLGYRLLPRRVGHLEATEDRVGARRRGFTELRRRNGLRVRLSALLEDDRRERAPVLNAHLRHQRRRVQLRREQRHTVEHMHAHAHTGGHSSA